MEQTQKSEIENLSDLEKEAQPNYSNLENRDSMSQEEDDDYSLCPFLKTLVIENKVEERDEGLLAFQIFVAKNKPSYKLLEDELMLLINKHYDSIAARGENPLKLYVSRNLELYETAKKRGFNPLVMKVFLKTNQRLKYERIKDFTEEIKKLALDFWTKVDGMSLKQFLTVFEIYESVNPEELLPIIKTLIGAQKLTEAAYYISAMNLHQHFDIPNLLSMLVHQNKFQIAALLVENHVDLQKLLIREMTTNKLASRAADYVKHFKLDSNEFPELLERLQKKLLEILRFSR